MSTGVYSAYLEEHGWIDAGDKEINSEEVEEEKKNPNKEQVMTTNLVDQELELDDSSTALMLTVALHARTAKA